jgi:O-antigen ligase
MQLLQLGLAAVVAPLVVRDPRLALWLLLIVELADLGAGGGSSLYLVAFALAAGAFGYALARGRARLVWSPVFPLAVAFLAARGVALFAARDPIAAVPVLVELAKDLLFLFLVTNLVVASRSYIGTARLIVAVLAALAALSLGQEFILNNATTFGGLSNIAQEADPGGVTARHSGPGADPNFWARTLALVVPLALSLWSHHRWHQLRWLWLCAAAALCGGVWLTQSRGGLLAAGLAVLAWLLILSRRRLLLAVLPLLLGALLLTPGVGSRLATLSSLGQAGSGGGDPSLVGRVNVQQAGIAMFLDHPAIGVGPGNFQVVESQYLRRLGLAGPVLAPHNLYLEMAAEAGLLGLTGWLLFYGCALLVATRALILSRRLQRGPRPSHGVLLSAGLLAGLLGWAFASLFLHLAEFRVLLALVALAAALDVERRQEALARLGAPDPSLNGAARAGSHLDLPAPAPPAGQRGTGWVAGRWVAAGAAVAAALVGGAVVVGVRQPAWSAERVAALEPVRSSSPDPYRFSDPYQYDVLSRELVVPTYAAIVGAPRFRDEAAARLGLTGRELRKVRLTVTGSPRAALITVTATSTDRLMAEQLAAATLDSAQRYSRTIGQPFVLTPIPPGPGSRPVAQVAGARLVLVVAFGGVAAMLVYAGYPRLAGMAGRRRSTLEDRHATHARRD